MKKYIILFLISLSISLASKAQPSAKISKDERAIRLSKLFSVDKIKAEEIALALDYNTDKIRTTAMDTTIDRKSKLEKLRKLHQERQAKLKATLTPEQLTILQEAIAARIKERKEKLDEQQKIRLKGLDPREIILKENKVETKL